MKKEIRKRVREKLHAMSEEEKKLKSKEIIDSIVKHSAVGKAKTIALFSSLPDEPCLGSLISDFSSSSCKVVLPKVFGDIMNFYSYSPDIMRIGAYGIEEPNGECPVNASEIDVIIVPGVAFTGKGARLGRGKGYYDKYMSQSCFRAYKIGVCYSCQLVDDLPCEEHDVVMDEVISDNQL